MKIKYDICDSPELCVGVNFHGEVINIRDIITFQGKSVEELKKAFQESVEDYFEFVLSVMNSQRSPFPDALRTSFPRTTSKNHIRCR